MSAPGKPDVGIPGNLLIPSSYLPIALDAVSAPVENAIHDIVSDKAGIGSVVIDLDYPIIGSAFPFHRFDGFDPEDLKLTLSGARAIPVAIVSAASSAPFTLRLASHCVDARNHGLMPVPHEGWFDWKMQRRGSALRFRDRCMYRRSPRHE